MSLDLDKLLVPVAHDNAGGESSEYDPLYMELDELASGLPPSLMGDSVVEGKEPDWRLLKRNCLELWQKTRDLRVAVYLTISSLCLDGLAGFRDGLKIIRYLTDELWADFWPRLDADDDNDPTERINIYSMLSPQQGSYSDPLAFISRFRDTALVEGKPYTLRDFLIASGEQEPGDASFNAPLFEAEMSAVPAEMMSSGLEIVSEIEEILKSISDAVYEKTGGEGAPDFASLRSELKSMRVFYASRLSVVGEEPASDNNEAAESNAVSGDASAGSSGGRAFNLNAFRPSSRGEALLLLRKSAEFFRSTEPTNPVPYLLERALRIAEMNFIELLGDIDPGSLDRIKEQLGIPRE